MAFYKFKLYGVISSYRYFDDEGVIMLEDVEIHLKNANGNDIEVDASSVGGDVEVGTDIYLAFRDYKRQYPKAQMILNVKSQCASMFSHIASGEFWDIITVEDISSWMMHNPSNYAQGDYRVMEANTDYLRRLSNLFADSYARRAGKSISEIRKMMDKINGTWLFGKEIVDAGFADEVLNTSEEKNKDSMFANMQLKYNSVMEKLKVDAKMKNEDILKAVAKIEDISVSANTNVGNTVDKTDEELNGIQPADGGENNIQEGVDMTFNEAKKTFPTELANFEQAGIDKGKAEMIANNKAVMEFMGKEEYKNLPFVQMRCVEALEKGESITDLKMSVQALMLDPKNQATIESPPDINSGGSSSVSGETQSEFQDEGL